MNSGTGMTGTSPATGTETSPSSSSGSRTAFGFGVNSNDREPIRLSSEGTFETSLSLGDPTLHTITRWHINMCEWCSSQENTRPPDFGKKDTRKCPEYYEIFAEYSEYEANYASKGNP